MLKRFQKFSTKSIKDASELTNSTLSLLHIVFRHGNRTPLRKRSYPSDPWKDLDYEPYGPGQLTNKGKQTMYDLGRFIRSQYSEFLGDYYPGMIEARSTCSDRTQCSLQLFLAGLYPPKGNLVWNSSLLWQPIPYITTETANDKILQAFSNDSNYKLGYAQYQQDIDVKGRFAKLFAYVEHNAKNKIETLDDIYLLYFRLNMQQEMGLELPDWTKKVFPNPFEELATLNYVYTCATPELRSYVLKNFTDKVIADTIVRTTDDHKVLMHIYSGHEMNVAHTLIAFGSFKPPHIPQYGACVILEVHVVNADVYVKGLYKRESDANEELLHFWGQNPLHFNDFVELISRNYQ